jgi:dTDP-4-dehydrorhamnose reductase
MNKKVIIFGGSGLLGNGLKHKFNIKNANYPTHEDINLLDIQKTFLYIEKNKPSAIIYSAGISKIDFAEKNKELTLNLNHQIPKKISKFIASEKIPFIYISTDAVFDGYTNKYLFTETDIAKPRSTYGISKLYGEQSILECSNLNSSIRLINLFDINKGNFIKQMLDSLKNDKTFLGITDQITNPLYTGTASEGIYEIWTKHLAGIYHLGALNKVSNFDLLAKIAHRFGLNPALIQKITFSDFTQNKSGHRKRKSFLLCDKFNRISNNTILKFVNDEIEDLFNANKNYLNSSI